MCNSGFLVRIGASRHRRGEYSGCRSGPAGLLYEMRATWPVTPVAVDAKRTTAWLHRQIVFDNEALEFAFLRSLKGVRVEVTATRIRVSRD